MNHELTAERLRELLHYDPLTGVFTRLVRTSNRIHVGDVAGTLDSHGYRQIRVEGRLRLAARLAWLYVHGYWPPDQIDHRNGVIADDRIANLRKATNSENKQNTRKALAISKTGLLGASPFRGRYMAQIQISGQVTYLGMFDTAEEAHATYLEAKRKIHPYGTL